MIKNKKIFITGGAGFLGKNIIEKYYNDNEIIIYSRDEAKHYYLKKKYPNIRCVIGDVRNYDLMLESSKDCNVGIFAASLKQISSVDENVSESVKVIIDGALNSRKIAEKNNFESACFISSDKSRAATTLYGSMKFVAGESFIVNSEESNVKLSSAIYGNVLNSTGSIIPLIWESINNNYKLPIYSENMTRFMINIDEAIDLIEYGLEVSGYNVVPNLKSFKVLDLFEIYQEIFGLKFFKGVPRVSEKLHEMLISKEESYRTHLNNENNTFYMHYKNTVENPLRFELTSDKTLVSKEELNNILKKNNYFKPKNIL
jgi:UDP-N-acetylglucosamine 4,6-dehydratase